MIANSCIAGSIVDVLTTGRADISAANSENEVAERESPRSAQEKGSFVLVFLLTVVCEHRQKSADAMGQSLSAPEASPSAVGVAAVSSQV